MATRPATVAFLQEQMGAVSARKMFGEYALFSGGKLIALVCDDQLYVKPTAAGRAHIGDPTEAPPYKGAKPCFLIDGDQWEDADWMTELARITAAALPMPVKKPKKPRSR